MLHTIQPGIGSAIIHIPSAAPCSAGRSDASGDFTPGRFKKTCRAFGVGSAYRKLVARVDGASAIISQNEINPRQAAIIPVYMVYRRHEFQVGHRKTYL